MLEVRHHHCVTRATLNEVIDLLRAEGASGEEASRIVDALGRAGLSPPQMRAWLTHPRRAYALKVNIVGVDLMEGPAHAVAAGRVEAVIAAAEQFADASRDERFLSRTLICEIDAVRRLTQNDPNRTAMLVRIAKLLLNRLGKDIAVNEALQTTLSGGLDDTTRLIDWMLDDRLPDAVRALESGRVDPVVLRDRGPLYFVGW